MKRFLAFLAILFLTTTLKAQVVFMPDGKITSCTVTTIGTVFCL